MYYKPFTFFKFLLKSQNQHGLHSPFVYDFVTKGLYKKKVKKIDFSKYNLFNNLSKKKQIILTKIINYFNIDEINFDEKNLPNTLDKTYKLLYISNIELINVFDFSNFNSKNIILINGIYQTKKKYKTWQKIINNKEVTVSIDLFYFGLIFFRKEQAKEHFIIRV